MVMRSDRCSRTQYLFTQNLSLSTLRQSRIKLDNAESKSLRSLLQILTAFHIHPSSLRSRVCHLFRFDVLVKLLACQESKLYGGFAQRYAFLVGILGNLGGVVVADVRIERCDEHERVLQVLVNLLAVKLYASDAVVNKAVTSILDEAYGMEQVVNHHGVEDVQFKVSLRACETNCRVVSHHLHGDHRHRFRLRGVHFARHDRRTWLVLRKHKLAKACARTTSQPANVVRNLHE